MTSKSCYWKVGFLQGEWGVEIGYQEGKDLKKSSAPKKNQPAASGGVFFFILSRGRV